MCCAPIRSLFLLLACSALQACDFDSSIDLSALCAPGAGAEREEDTQRPDCRAILERDIPAPQADFQSKVVVIGEETGGKAPKMYAHGVDEKGRPFTEADWAEAEIVADDGRGGRRSYGAPSVSAALDLGGVLAVGVALDWSSSMRPVDVERAVGLARRVLDALPPGAAVQITAFSDDIEVVTGFETDLAVARAAVGREPTFERGGTALYDAVAGAVDRLAARPEPLRFLIVITDGLDNASRRTRLTQLPDRIRAARVSVLPVFVFLADPDVARRIAHLTGTFFFGARFDDLVSGVTAFADSLARLQVVELPADAAGAESLFVRLGGRDLPLPRP